MKESKEKGRENQVNKIWIKRDLKDEWEKRLTETNKNWEDVKSNRKEDKKNTNEEEKEDKRMTKNENKCMKEKQINRRKKKNMNCSSKTIQTPFWK